MNIDQFHFNTAMNTLKNARLMQEANDLWNAVAAQAVADGYVFQVERATLDDLENPEAYLYYFDC